MVLVEVGAVMVVSQLFNKQTNKHSAGKEEDEFHIICVTLVQSVYNLHFAVL